MRETILFDAITNLSDIYVEEAANYKNRQPNFLKTAGWLAACLALVVTVTMALPYLPLFRAGSAAPESPAATESPKLEMEEEAPVESMPEMDAAPPQSGEPMFTIQTDTQTMVLSREGNQYTLETLAEIPETVTVAFPGDVQFQSDDGSILKTQFDGLTTTAEVTVTPEKPLIITILPS